MLTKKNPAAGMGKAQLRVTHNTEGVVYIQYITEVPKDQMGNVLPENMQDVVLSLFRGYRASETVMNLYIRKLNNLTSNLDKVRALESRLTSATPHLAEVSVSSSHDPGRLSDGILELVALKQRLAEIPPETARMVAVAVDAIEHNAQKLGECLQLLDSIEDPVVRQVLTLRYLDDMPWERVAEKMHMSERRVYDLRADGLKRAAEIYGSFRKDCSKLQ